MRTFKIIKDLIKCPAGRIFKQTVRGDYFHSITDIEYIEDKYKLYYFEKDDVENNPDWFIEIK